MTGFAERIYCPAAAASAPSPLEGYLMVRWTVDGALYQVAVAGDAGGHRRVADEIILGVQMVPPA